METNVKKSYEQSIKEKQEEPIVLFNPEGTDYSQLLKVKSIEFNDEYTRIDFLYKASNEYINGGWIQMHDEAFIRPVGSETKYRLIQAINIPIAPSKLHFQRQGQLHRYTLLFPALPKTTQKIDIIEKEAPGTYFNFYNVDFSTWMTIPHAADQRICSN
ncbi:MAG: hypothetical protein FJZ80_00660 [Bacteroidetes bacterium]|nr:hypothetical protein [Bacteroidota bacterium]MBM3424955.1 hypothetical protein [Bacteroidota bacterium]